MVFDKLEIIYNTLHRIYNVKFLYGNGKSGIYSCFSSFRTYDKAWIRSEGRGGSSVHYGIISVKKEGGIKTSKDMMGNRYFRKKGIQDYRRYVKDTYFAGTSRNGFCILLNTKADIRAIRNTLFYGLTNSDKKFILDKFGKKSFIETQNRDYEPVFKYAHDIGTGLSRYNYRNEQ